VLSAGTQLLAIAGQLRRSVKYDDVESLFRLLSQEIRAFEAALAPQRVPPEEVSIARYMLCGFLDEAILNTPWGTQSSWGNHTLLAEFHNETDAGEKVYEILERIKADPGRYLHLLELIYVCLCLGFQGKYRSRDVGYDELERIREDLYVTISRQRGPYERALSPRWQGAKELRPRFTKFLPVWIVAAVTCLVLLVTFAGLLQWLYSDSDPVMRDVNEIGRFLDPVVAQRIDLAKPVQQRTLLQLMERQIRAGYLEQGGHNNKIVVRNLFDSGAVEVIDNAGVLRDIAVALDQLSGKVIITGHTDNVPAGRSLRFPSNWELSDARAQAVVNHLVRNNLPAHRITAEPRADSEPMCRECDQNAYDERARNRRVEIELRPGARRL
jgi:type VI secretion system protein ImpK